MWMIRVITPTYLNLWLIWVKIWVTVMYWFLILEFSFFCTKNMVYLSGWIGSYIVWCIIGQLSAWWTLNPLVLNILTCGCLFNDFITSVSWVPDAQTQNNLRHLFHRKQRMIDRFEDFLVEYPLCEISEAVV